MAKSPSKAQWRALRRYALSGETEAARNLLQKMVSRYPNDAEVAAELDRLNAGKKLLITENATERKARRCAEAQQAILYELTHRTPQILACMHTAELQTLYAQLKANLQAIRENAAAAPEGTRAYKKALEYELSRRHKRFKKAAMFTGSIAASVVLLLAITAFFLHKKAQHIGEELQAAHAAAEWLHTDSLLKAADTGIYRLMNPGLDPLIAKVRRWQQQMHSRAQELTRQIVLYENLDAISTLSVEERADFLRRIRALPDVYSQQLLMRWDDLCRPEKEELDRQRNAILTELEHAAEPPTLTGDAREDANILRATRHKLQRLIASFRDAQDAFGLESKHIEPVRLRLEYTDACLADIGQLLRLEAMLRIARTCEQHHSFLAEFQPVKYAPALALADAGSTLPNAEHTAKLLRSLRYKMPIELHPDVVNAIVEKGPSFSQSHPATPEQVHLMEDIFTSQTLRRKLYEVIHPSGKTYYSNAAPEVTEKNTAVFDISDLDPEYRIDHTRRQEWENAQAVWIRPLDATPLLKATGISRDTFFLTFNVPDMLGRITAVQNKTCPALAKAYMYHTLLRLIDMHQQPGMIGIRFSPTLQQDIASFRNLQKRVQLPLTVTCWLQRTADVLNAEKQYGQWFEEHKNRDYAAEMSRNLSRILRERPHYLGYVDAQQQPHYREQLPPGARIRYYSEGQLISGSAADPLSNPTPFSPIIAE